MCFGFYNDSVIYFVVLVDCVVEVVIGVFEVIGEVRDIGGGCCEVVEG